MICLKLIKIGYDIGISLSDSSNSIIGCNDGGGYTN